MTEFPATTAQRVLEGDVVWIRPEQLALPNQPIGVALRIDAFRGVDGQDDRGVTRVWVCGRWHDGHRWRGELEVLIPMDQPFARDFTAISAPAFAR